MTNPGQTPSYYEQKLAAEKLRTCYEIAPPRVRQYLQAEVDHLLSRMTARARVLDLGCGYGRIIPRIAPRASRVVGIDLSLASLQAGRHRLLSIANAHLARMDAARMGLRDDAFDLVACIQNGLSAFQRDPGELIAEALRVTRPGGWALFSTYAASFWEHRLNWFRLQAEAGLLGAIDEEKTVGGVIACRDGFRSRSFTADELLGFASGLAARAATREVDGSSLFLELEKLKA